MTKEEKRCTRKIHHTKEEKSDYIKRLNKIEGQVRGISKMIEDDRHCDDVLIQISAVTSALKSLGNEILINHMKTCMVDDIQKGELESIDEILYLWKRLK